MKATIIGTDLLEKNGEVKILEINTNTTIYNEGAVLLNYDPLFEVLTNNNITELHFIWTEQDSFKPLNQSFEFKNILEEKCLQNNITFLEYVVPVGSVTVPFIEDAPNKFILRQAFDTTALVDETYCADKFGFLKLMEGTTYLPKTYMPSNIPGFDGGMDTLDSVDLTDQNNPNLITKKRGHYDAEIFPELYIISEETEIGDLKDNVDQNNDTFVQEFIFSSENSVNGRYSVVRSIDIIYGPSLDTINLGGYKQSTIIPVSFYANEFVEGTKKLNKKSRYKYITKELGGASVDYHTDGESSILKYDGTLADVNSIQLGDLVRSIDFEDFNGNHAANLNLQDLQTFGWDGTLEKSNQTLSQMSSELNNIYSTLAETIYIRVTLSDGRTWVDSPSCTYYIEELGSTETRFERLNKMYVGDKLVVTDSNTNLLTTAEIANLEMEYVQKTIYTLDFEPSDLFLVDVGEGDFSVMHNGCWCPSSFCGNWCYDSNCSGCGGGGPQKL